MDLRFFEGETITIHRKTFTGEYTEATSEPIYTTSKVDEEGLLYYRKSDSRVTPYETLYASELTVIFNAGTVIHQSDVFEIRGQLWETESIEQPVTRQARYDRFLKPGVFITLKQYKGTGV